MNPGKRARRWTSVFSTLLVLILSAGASPAAMPEHLYIAVAGQSSQSNQILRYPIIGGVPAPNPDLTISGAVAPIAVGDDGTLYANNPWAINQYAAIINVYPPGATAPSRQIAMPPLIEFTNDVALAAGRGGFLYAGFISYLSGDAVSSTPAPDSASEPYHGVMAYGPLANGHAKPASIYTFHDMPIGPTALAATPAHQLLVAGYSHPRRMSGQILTLERPWQGLDIVSRLATAQVFSIAVSGADTYTLSGSGSVGSVISVYHRHAHSNDKPYRSFVVQTGAASMALLGNKAYVSGYGDLLLGYLKDSSGNPTPIFSRQYPGEAIYAIASGP